MALYSVSRVRGGKIVRWLLTTSDNVGDPFLADEPEKSVEVRGTFGGGTVTVKGSNSHPPGSGMVLKNTLGLALSFSAAGLEQVLQSSTYIWPEITGSTGASVEVYLYLRS